MIGARRPFHNPTLRQLASKLAPEASSLGLLREWSIEAPQHILMAQTMRFERPQRVRPAPSDSSPANATSGNVLAV